MSKSINVTRNYRDVLPKVKGHRFEVKYLFDEYPTVGNISVHLWERYKMFPEIVGAAYVRAGKQVTHEEVQKRVRLPPLNAIEDAKRRGYSLDGKTPQVPANIVGGNK